MSVAALDQIASRLTPAAKHVEHGFLAAGENLERAVAILDRLNARFAAHAAELTGGRLDSASEGLDAAACQVTRLADAHGAEAATLGGLSAIVGATIRRVAKLHPITQEIDILALNARVIAAGMGADGRDFLAFTASIQAAVQRARSSLGRVGDDLLQVDRDLRAARTGAEAFALRQEATIRAIPQRLERTNRTLTARRKAAGDAAATARQRAAAISRKVAEQITALQLGDIVRQRLEHMAAGVRLLANQPAGIGLAGRVLAAQLADAASALEAEGQRIEIRLTQLAANAIAIDQLGMDIQAEAADRQDSFITGLRSDLRQTTALLAELRAADGDAEQRIHAVLDATGILANRLTGVQSVERDIHIIGLNATLKCGRLGADGRALAAVAQELRHCGRRFAGEAAGVLDELGRLRSQVAGLLDPERQNQHAALAQAAETMLAAVEQLHRLEDELRQGMLQLQTDAEQVGRLMADALEQFSVRETVAALMRDSARQIESCGGADGPDTTALLQRIAATYTMTREREVHARLTPLTLSEAAGASDADDFLF
ncbi:MAG TPA: hypothetical protein VFN42_01260 [Acetobacteraceae bacterium]|nr:hypothetical protein [Acetobacteraceae bacterium]